MELPRRLTLHDFDYLLDGGTVVLRGTDEAGRKHVVTLRAHMRASAADAGRLYFDGDLVAIRSAEESAVLQLLRAASLRCAAGPPPGIGPNMAVCGDDIKQVLGRTVEQNVRALTADVIGFVGSDGYIEFAEQVRKAQHPTRYTVRALNDPARRKHIIVGLARVLHIGVSKARKRLDTDPVIGIGVTALKVTELADRCAAEGVAVEVDPEFPWPLPAVS